MEKPKVLVSSNDFPESALNILREHVVVIQTKYNNFGEEGRVQNAQELLKLIPGCSGLVWISDQPISVELLDAAGSSLKIVSTSSAGYNHCRPAELLKRNIKLTNTPNVLSAAVSEVAIMLMLGAARRLTENLQLVRSGEWEISFNKMLGTDVSGSTVGIVGLGGIGQAVCTRLSGFQVGSILYTGHKEKTEGKALGAKFVSLEELLSESDFVILCVPLTDETRGMINARTISKMKKNTIIINVGRGDLIDQDALYNALRNGDIYGAGLDVTTPEPLPKDHELLTLPNIFITPHIGSATKATRRKMAELAANNIVNYFLNKPLITPVFQ